LAEKYYPLPFVAPSVAEVVGSIIVVLSFVLFALVLREFSKFKTSVDHRKATVAIISTGAFKYSRNPIYISMVMLCIGLSFLANSVWGFVSALLASLVVTQFVIKKEEAYLEEKFGKEYVDYRKSVRRWL